MWKSVLAVAVTLQQLSCCVPEDPEWNLDGLGDAETAVGSEVTLAEVRAACQVEAAACEKDEECAVALAESFAPGSVLHPRPPTKLIEVMKCFKSGNSQESARRMQAAANKAGNIKAIADDIACQFCGHLVEDMWSMVVQNVYQHQVQTSVEQETRMWLEDLCAIGQQSSLTTLQKFVGLYDISPSEEDRSDGKGKQYRINRDVPWANDPAGAYSPTFGYVGDYEDTVVAKSTREDRQWSESQYCSTLQQTGAKRHATPKHHTLAHAVGRRDLSWACSVAGVCTAVC
jgi:hypothetical protein